MTIRVNELPIDDNPAGTPRALIVDESGTLLIQGPEYIINGLIDVDAAVPSGGQRLTWDAVAAKWVPKQSTSALGIVAFQYEFKTGGDTTPPVGNVTLNAATQNLATVIYVNKVNGTGEDISLFLDNLQKGSWLNLYERSDVDNSLSFDVIGPPTVVGDIYEVPVEFFAEAGNPMSNNLKIELFIRFTGAQTQVPAGGTTGQVLTKLSDDDYDVGWVTP